jgi:Tfp pilus assembly protein PilF
MKTFATVLLFFLLLSADGTVTVGQEQPKDRAKAAEELYNTGYLLGILGWHHEAIQLFEKSLAIMPTAEAYTYLGWSYSHMGDYKRAIEEAQKAIRIDPNYGNPYNDIGVYLIEQGKEDEAIPYFEKAMRATRYCCYQFPHFNLGRIYLKNKMYEKARQEFKKSLEIDPDYLPARQGLDTLKALGFSDT